MHREQYESSMDPWNGFKRNKCKNSEEKEMEGEKKTIKKSYCERFFHTLVWSQIRLPNSTFCMIKVSRSNNPTGRQLSYLSQGFRKYCSHPAITQVWCRENFQPFTGRLLKGLTNNICLYYLRREACVYMLSLLTIDLFLHPPWLHILCIFTALTASLLINGTTNRLVPVSCCDCCIFPQTPSDW